ncbi:hypothetical protein L6452_25539 [Arctium lappa]|uniref:Uncharacterized protein n=1 Tax=Arctium lappa TaxID=4217 RepID=A0ACB9ABJ6_ARCLA|nr:hypothetical protein L6452_25539 [Arctium lappa]
MITALMKNQVMALKERGVTAESLYYTKTSLFRNKVSSFLNSFSIHNQSVADLCCQWLHIHVIYSLMDLKKGRSTLTICEPRLRRL